MQPPPNGRPEREQPRRARRMERRKPRKRADGFLGGLLLLVVGVISAIAIVAVIGSYTFLPGMVSERIATGVREDFELDRTPQAEVRSDPPPEMLLGRFSGGEIGIGASRFWGFNVESIEVRLDPFDVDIPASLRQRTLVYEDAASGSIEAVVSSDEVSRVAREESGLDGVRLQGGRLVVEQDPQLFGDISLPIEVRGDLSLRGEGSLVYTPDQVRVAGVSLPQDTVEEILSGVELAFPIEDVAEGVTLRGVDISGDELVLDGDIQKFG